MFREASHFEAIRYKTDMYSLKNRRPVVFILTVGNQTMRRARAEFSCNFFAAGGFEIIDNNGFSSVEQGVTDAKIHKADIIVVCSSDEEYAGFVPEAAGLLDNEILVVAGNPVCRSILEEKGIVNFIHIRSNTPDELTRYQALLFK